MVSKPEGVEFSSGQRWEPRVIDGAGSGGSRYKHVGDTTGGGGSGGDPMIDIAEIKQALKGAFLWLGLLTIASGVAFLWLLGTVNTGFDGVNQRAGEVGREISAQGSTLGSIDRRLERMEGKIDANQPQRSPTEKPIG